MNYTWEIQQDNLDHFNQCVQSTIKVEIFLYIMLLDTFQLVHLNFYSCVLIKHLALEDAN